MGTAAYPTRADVQRLGSLGKQCIQHRGSIREEIAGNRLVFRLLTGHFLNATCTETVKRGLWIGHENGRVRGYYKLTALCHIGVQQCQELELPGGRQRRFGFVHQIQGVCSKAVLEQREERLPMRLLMQRHAAVGAIRPGSRVSISVAKLKLQLPPSEFFSPMLISFLIRARRYHFDQVQRTDLMQTRAEYPRGDASGKIPSPRS